MAQTANEQLAQLQEQRQLLQRLTTKLRQLRAVANNLASLSWLEQPPDQLPPKLARRLGQRVLEVEQQGTDPLMVMLAGYNQDLQRRLWDLVRLADQQSDERLSVDDDGESFEDIQQRLATFLDRVEHDLAIRIVLRQRGIGGLEVELPVPAERLAARVHALRAQERRCRDHLVRELDQIQQQLVNQGPGYDDPRLAQMAERVQEVRSAVARGVTPERLPVLIEAIALDTWVDVIEQRSVPAAEESPLSSKGFWWRLRHWLTSPWSVRWRDVQAPTKSRKS